MALSTCFNGNVWFGTDLKLKCLFYWLYVTFVHSIVLLNHLPVTLKHQAHTHPVDIDRANNRSPPQ